MSEGSPNVRSMQALRFSVLALLVAAVSAVAAPAAAQAPPTDPSRWGVTVSFVPSWTMADRVKDLLADEGTTLNVDGTEFSVGFVRGSRLGGDMGVSFVRKPWKDGSGFTEVSEDCFNQAQTICRPRTEVTETQNVVLTGLEIHWFLRFVNIKERVQIGMNVAGGIGKTSGQVTTTTDEYQVTGFIPPNTPVLTPVHTEETLETSEELFPYFPLFKLEAVASVILAPGYKIQFAYGVNFPSYSARVMGVCCSRRQRTRVS